jgi:hypothetical protein
MIAYYLDGMLRVFGILSLFFKRWDYSQKLIIVSLVITFYAGYLSRSKRNKILIVSPMNWVVKKLRDNSF